MIRDVRHVLVLIGLLVCLPAACVARSDGRGAPPPSPLIPAGPPSSPLASVSPPSPAQPTSKPNPAPSTSGVPTASASLTRPQISIRADLDYAAHRLEASQVLTYANHTGAPLPDILLDVMAARMAGVFSLKGGTVRGQPAARFSLEGTALRIQLDRPLEPGEAAVMDIDFGLALPPFPMGGGNIGGTLGWSARQTNLGDWFPAVSAFRQGWVAARNPSHPVGETTAPEAMDISLDLQITNAPPGLRLVAGSPAERVGDRLGLQLHAARSLALSLSTAYEIVEAQAGGILVRSAFFPDYAAAGRAALEATVKALEVYGRQFGAYPYRQLTLVQADFLDGMEFSGLYFLGTEYYAQYDGTPRNYLTAIAVHETAHQWWYGQVGNDQGREPWLDEALATYSELVYYEALDAALPSWWWDIRVARLQPQGWVNSPVYDYGDFRTYINAVYLRGALFFRDLRAAMGDQAFFAMLQRYQAGQVQRVAAGADFWQLVQEYNVPGLEGIRAEYYKP